MCGRYTLTNPQTAFRESFPEYTPTVSQPPRYNIAPGQSVPAILNDGRRRIITARWGLVPAWAAKPSIGNRLINARAESIAERPAFRQAYIMHRCLLPADGFYEWLHRQGRRLAFYFHRRDNRAFAFAGLWSRWHDPDTNTPLLSCTLITTKAAEPVRRIHQRMPLILPADLWDAWLQEGPRPPIRDDPLLKGQPLHEFAYYPVSSLVNNPANERPECVQPAPQDSTLPLLLDEPPPK